jgi:predicted 2-oxoglutarate/Fe(II)-dependent dioxygenase YbiX
MDILTKEECQTIINADHDWKVVDLVKKSGCIIKCQSAEFKHWSNKYPTILKEQVVKYGVGDFCSEHIDTAWPEIHPNYRAHTTWITPLSASDDYEGGELYIEDELTEQLVGVPIKFLRTTLHEITKITKGTRYSLVAWVFIKRDSPLRNHAKGN